MDVGFAMTTQVPRGDIESGVPLKKNDVKSETSESKARSLGRIITDAGQIVVLDALSRLAYSAMSGRISDEPSALQEAIQKISAENLFPESLKSALEVCVAKPLRCLNGSIASYFPWTMNGIPLGLVFGSAIVEQLLFQGFVQQGVLKKLPQAVWKMYRPGDTDWVNDAAAKVSRVVLTALFFALCHTSQWQADKLGCVPQFMAGLIYGTAVEQKGNVGLMACVVAHVAVNSFLTFLGRI